MTVPDVSLMRTSGRDVSLRSLQQMRRLTRTVASTFTGVRRGVQTTVLLTALSQSSRAQKSPRTHSFQTLGRPLHIQ